LLYSALQGSLDCFQAYAVAGYVVQVHREIYELAKDTCDIEDVLITDELRKRPPAKTDYLREKLALQDLALQMADHPADVLPRLVALAMELCDADSAGMSLFEAQPGSPGVFRWHYLSGLLAAFSGATTPRDFSPCGVCLDQGTPVLMANAERFYPWIAEAKIRVPEVLLVPLVQRADKPLGTLWIIAPEGKPFDAGHARVLGELAAFTGLAMRIIAQTKELKDAVEQQETLTREMSHRVKNLLAITSSIVSMTGQTAATPKEMTDSVLGRLHALAQSHALIRRTSDVPEQRNGNLESAIETILRPYDRVARSQRHSTLSGPEVQLGEHALTSLALVFHEMATNAAKYGALSTPQGHVHAEWRIEADRLMISWRETGGPKVNPTQKAQGFGGKLVHHSVVRQLGGELTYDWRPEGVRADLTIPLERLSR
jgi:two-component sensor histidine kinase